MYIYDNATDQKRVLPKRRPMGALCVSRNIGALILEYFGDQQERKKKNENQQESVLCLMILRKIDGFQEVGLIGTELIRLAPGCKSFESSVNRKTDLRSRKARAGEGLNHPDQRQNRRTNRTLERLRRKHEAMEISRGEKTERGLFLCNAKCPSTQRYCSKEFLTELQRNKHDQKGKHEFPKVDSKTAALVMANRPGGLVAAGTRPNLKSPAMFATIQRAPPNEPSAKDASSFGKFNRKELSQDDIYHKPEKLVKEMTRLYKIGQDGSCPKKKAFEVWADLGLMRDPKDGGLMFCYSKRGSFPRKEFCELCQKKPCKCNGMLPSKKKIGEWMNTQTQNKKKAEKKAGQAA
jgi:hypothetical protein